MARAGAAPVSETRLLTEAEVTGWVRMARPGESLIYCSGLSSVPLGPTKKKVIALRDDGVILPRSRRSEDGWEHLIVKRADVPAAMDPAPRSDAEMEAIFAALRRCAQRRRRAYSDAELARIAGLASRNQAAWRVRKLIEAGRMASETVSGPDGPWRIVTIGKLRTARPPAGKPA